MENILPRIIQHYILLLSLLGAPGICLCSAPPYDMPGGTKLTRAITFKGDHKSNTKQRLAVVQNLLLAGENPNHCDDKGQTPLIIECGRDDCSKGIVELLLHYGAKVRINSRSSYTKNNSTGTSALGAVLFADTPSLKPKLEIIALLLQNGADIKKLSFIEVYCLTTAITKQHRDNRAITILRSLCSQKNTSDDSFFYEHCLSSAVKWGNCEAVKLLLDVNANPTIVPIYNSIADQAIYSLETAILDYNFDIAELLLAKGSAIKSLKSEFFEHLTRRYTTKKHASVKFLLEHGMNPNDYQLIGNNGDTPLIWMAKEHSRHFTFFQQLKEGSPYSKKPLNQMNDIHQAICLLLTHGANPHAKNNEGKTFRDYATHSDYDQIIAGKVIQELPQA